MADDKSKKPDEGKTTDEDDEASKAKKQRLDPAVLKARHGGAEAALIRVAAQVDELEADNAKYRRRIAELKKQIPAEGTVVLQGDDLKEYQALVALGKSEEVKKRLDDGDRASEALRGREAADKLRTVAEAAGVNYDALQLAPGSQALVYEIMGEGKDRKVNVKYKNAQGQETVKPLEEYADEHWKPIVNSLFSNGGQSQSPRMLKQGAQGGGAGKVTDEEIVMHQRERGVDTIL